MLTTRQAARSAFMVFLPATIAFGLLVVVIEALVRRGSLVGVGHGLNLPLFIGGPAAMALGYALMLLVARRHVRSDLAGRTLPHILSAIVCIVLLGALSILTQGASLPFIVTAYVIAGAFSAAIPASRQWTAREV